MTAAERWLRVQSLFHEAVDLEPSGRAAFLAEACAGDAALQCDVESLLAADGRAGDFIEQPAVALMSPQDLDFDGVSGRPFGAYRVVREIARGGMGAVYLATRSDDAYQKHVAIKLLKRGMDTDFFIARFRRERQILARLDHPHIASLIDAGTTDDGLPYLVMEFVEGLPIDAYCAERQLSIPARLALFVTVCVAVEYAHHHLVVHRDLKPANVIVTLDGTPKLLDFGIAKLLEPAADSDGGHTATGVRMMTPGYASPEQLRGEPATTSTDVYALGVLLFQLLTGSRPYRSTTGGPEELARAISERDPALPSNVATAEHAFSTGSLSLQKLRRRLVGDLDTIVLKAIRKEPERRYASVEQLVADIKRHLAGFPVVARNDTLWYRTGKFVRRHRAGLAAAALVVVSLIAGLSATLVQAQIARAERARAERRFNDVRALANSFVFEFHDAIATLPGSTPARKLVVKTALAYLESLSAEAAGDLTLQRELAEAYLRIGHVQGNVFWPNLGDAAGALASYRKALAIEQTILAQRRDDSRTLRSQADTYRALSQVLWGTGDWTGALDTGRRAVVIREQLAAAAPADDEIRAELADSYVGIGDVLRKTGDFAGALHMYRRGRVLLPARGTDAANHQMRRTLVTTDYKIAGSQQMLGELTSAIQVFRTALEGSEELAALEPSSAHAKRNVALISSQLGDVLLDTGDVRGAVDAQTRSTALLEELSAADPTNVQARGDLALGWTRLGEALARSGRTIEALARHQDAIAAFDTVLRAEPSAAESRLASLIPHYRTGELLEARGDDEGALRSYQRALGVWTGLSPEQRVNPELKPLVARLYGKLGSWSASNERCRRAREWFGSSLEMWQEVRKGGPLPLRDAGEPERIASELARCEAVVENSGAAQ